MKFKHEFQDALIQEGFPQHWVESAVPYGKLKKVIRKVKEELDDILEEFGLDSADLVSAQTAEDGAIAFQYQFDGDKAFRPKLSLTFDGDTPVDASLSPGTRGYLKALVANRRRVSKQSSALSDSDPTPFSDAEDVPLQDSITSTEFEVDKSIRASVVPETDPSTSTSASIRQVDVPLTFDSEFFLLLRGDVTNLDELQAEEEKVLLKEIGKLKQCLARLTAPSRFTKTDMYRWRQLFAIYIHANIFFSTREQDRGSQSATVAAKQLNFFQDQVMKEGIVSAFKLEASHAALKQFVTINIKLLQNVKFREMNTTAIGKILKKFDKRTRLGARDTFPQLIKSEPIMTTTMAKAVCEQISENLVEITPQMDDDDYMCHVCFDINYRPIRLGCGHYMCSGCAVESQLKNEYRCGLCRKPRVIGEATEDNIDDELLKKILKYFPKESRAKRIELETADGKRTWGPGYTHPSEKKSSCTVM